MELYKALKLSYMQTVIIDIVQLYHSKIVYNLQKKYIKISRVWYAEIIHGMFLHTITRIQILFRNYYSEQYNNVYMKYFNE